MNDYEINVEKEEKLHISYLSATAIQREHSSLVISLLNDFVIYFEPGTITDSRKTMRNFFSKLIS